MVCLNPLTGTHFYLVFWRFIKSNISLQWISCVSHWISLFHQLLSGLNKRCGAAARHWKRQVFIALCNVQVTVIISRWQWQSPMCTRWWYKALCMYSCGELRSKRGVEKTKMKSKEGESQDKACALCGSIKPLIKTVCETARNPKNNTTGDAWKSMIEITLVALIVCHTASTLCIQQTV